MSLLMLLAACQGTLVIGTTDAVIDTGSPDTDPDPEVIGGDTSDTDTEELHDVGEAPPDVVVDCNGAGDFRTITEAIDAMPSGTRIGLSPCTYDESVDFRGKALDIFGMEGPDVTTIHGAGGGSVITAARGETVGTRLAHVTVTGGGASYGAGALLDSSVITFQDVVFTGNDRTTAVIYALGVGLTLIDVTLTDNQVSRGGGVIWVDNGYLAAQRLTLICEGADYGIVEHEAVLILDSTIECEGADVGIYVSSAELHVRRSDIVGGSYGIYSEDSNDTRNERLWLYNTSVTGDDVGVYTQYNHVKIRNATIWGGRTGLALSYAHRDSYLYSSFFSGSRCGVQGDGYAYTNGWNALGESDACSVNLADAVTGDPMFVDAPEDFRLAEGSPLIDAGDPAVGENDDDDTRNDIGRYGGPEADGPR